MPSALRLALVVFLLCTGTASAAEPAPTGLPAAPGSEAPEPNDEAETATPIAAGERVRATRTRGDVDLYSFTAEAGDRVFAAVITSGSGASDSRLALLGPDGTEVESDNDNGSFGANSSSIAGAELPASGTYHLRVDAPAAATLLLPYDLVLDVKSGAPTAEVEPNNGAESAQPLDGERFVAGTKGDGDTDFYKLDLGPGDTVFVSLDLDPERDGTSVNGRLAFGNQEQLLAVNDAGNADAIPSEAWVGTVATAGTYLVGVDSGGAAALSGTYELSVTVISAVERSCRTYAITPAPVEGALSDVGAVTFPIEVPDAATIDHVAVRLDLTHTFMADLDATLQAPQGNRTALFDDIGSTTVGAFTQMQATFDDNAGTPPLYQWLKGYGIQPDRPGRLSWFEGQQAEGTWNLTFRDDANQDVGQLARADLILCARPEEGPVETVFSAGFESGDDGFTHSGTADEWERGTPTTPAGGELAELERCAEGTGCFKTDLDGTYDASSSQDLLSPPISLAGRTGTIYAAWQMWYQLEDARFEHMTVFVEEDGGGDPRPLFTWVDGDMIGRHGNPITAVPFAAGWGRHRADISEYAGRTIRLRFHVDSDTTVQRRGVAIDDVQVYQPAFDLGLDLAGSGSGYVDSTPAGIDCGTDAVAHPTCSVTRAGAVTLTAHPDADSRFVGFSGGGCSGTSCTVTLDQARTVTAAFELLPFAPVAEADAYVTQEDTPLSVDAPGVLGDDSDRNGDALTAVLESLPQHGTLELAADGSFTYAPDADYNGSDSFTYRASDGAQDSEPAKVTIEVNAVDDTAPPAAAPPTAAPPAPPAVVEPAISDLRLASRCVRRSGSGRARVRMSMRLAQPGALQVQIARAVGSRNRRSCPNANPVQDRDTRFRPVMTVRPRTQAATAAVTRRVTLDLRLTPGLYRISVRVQMEDGSFSAPARRFLRVIG